MNGKHLFICTTIYQVGEAKHVLITPIIAASEGEAITMVQTQTKETLSNEVWEPVSASALQVEDKFVEQIAKEVLGWGFPEVISVD